MGKKRFDLLLPHTIVNDTVKRKSYYFDEKEDVEKLVALLNQLNKENEKKDRIIKGQDAEISRLYNLAMAMSGVLREEFGVYDVFDRSKDKRVK